MSLMETLNAIYDAGSLIGEANNFVFDNFDKITSKESEQIIDELYRVDIILATIWDNLERITDKEKEYIANDVLVVKEALNNGTQA